MVPSPATSATSSPSKHAARHATRATIVSESGGTWTVKTKAGATIAVTITPQTEFGTKTAPATASQFRAGSAVIITGTVSQTVITATRVVAAKPPAASTPVPTVKPTS